MEGSSLALTPLSHYLCTLFSPENGFVKTHFSAWLCVRHGCAEKAALWCPSQSEAKCVEYVTYLFCTKSMQVKITQVVFPVCLSCMSEFDQIHISTDVKRVWISTQLPSSKHVPAVVHGQVCYATCTLIGYTNPCCMDLSRASFTNAGSLCKENLAQCHMMCLHVKFSHWTHPYGYESESRTLTAEPQRRI